MTGSRNSFTSHPESVRVSADSERDPESLFERLFTGLTKFSATVVALAWTGLVAVADRLTGVEPVFTLLYVVPIVLVTWYLGRRAGYFSAVFCGVCGVLVDHFARPALLHGWITTWNNTAQFGVFLVIAALVDALRRRVMRESYERRLAVDQLRHADRLNTIGMLAAGIAHELGTSLNIVLGQAQLIENGRAIGEDAKSSARSIIGRSERMTAIIRQLLDFGRRSGKGRRRAKLIDLAADTAGLLGKLARDHKVRIEVVPTEVDTTVFVNVSEIEQVVSNLVVNAIQSMPKGGRVVVSGGLEDHPALSKEISCTWLSIEDDGEGIAREDIDHIFDPFFTTKPVGEGTGLGLSVAYGIVADHGGWFTVTSKPGKGSRFAIHFPVRQPSGDSLGGQ